MKKNFLFCFLLITLSFASYAQTTYTFVNNAGTGNNEWNNAPNWSPNGVPGPADNVIIDVSKISATPAPGGGGSNVLSINSTGFGSCKSLSLINVIAGKTLNIQSGLDVFGDFDLTGANSFSVTGVGAINFKGTASTWTINTNYTNKGNIISTINGITVSGNYILADHLHHEAYSASGIWFYEGCNFNSNGKDVLSFSIGHSSTIGNPTTINLSNSKVVTTALYIGNLSANPLGLDVNNMRLIFTDSILGWPDRDVWLKLGLQIGGSTITTSTIQSVAYHFYNSIGLGIDYNDNRRGETNLISTMPLVTISQVKTINNLYMSSGFNNPLDKMYINDFVFERGVVCSFDYNPSLASPYKIGQIRSSGKCDSIVYLKNENNGYCQIKLDLLNNCTVSNFSFSDINIFGAGTLTANNSHDLGGNGGNLIITAPVTRILQWNGLSPINNHWNDKDNWYDITAGANAACPPSPADSVILDYAMATGYKSAYIDFASFCGGMLVRGQSSAQTFSITSDTIDGLQKSKIPTLTITKGLYFGYSGVLSYTSVPTDIYVNWSSNAVINFISSKRDNAISTHGVTLRNAYKINFSGQGKWYVVNNFNAPLAFSTLNQGHLEFGYFPYPNDSVTVKFRQAYWASPYRTTILNPLGDRRDTVTLNRVKLILNQPNSNYADLYVDNYYQTLKVTNGDSAIGRALNPTDISNIISVSTVNGYSNVFGPYVDMANSPCLEFGNFKTLNSARNYILQIARKQALVSSAYDVRFNKISNDCPLSFIPPSYLLPHPNGSNIEMDTLDISSGQAVTLQAPASLTSLVTDRNSIVINKAIITSSLCISSYGILNSSSPSIPADIKAPASFTMIPTRVNIQNVTVNAFGSGAPMLGFTGSITATSSLKSGNTNGWIVTGGIPRLFHWNGEGLGDASNPVSVTNANWSNPRNWNVSDLDPASSPAYSAILGTDNTPSIGLSDDPNSTKNLGGCIPGPEDSVVFVNTSFPSPSTYTVNLDSTSWANSIHWATTTLNNSIVWKNTVNGNLNINSSLYLDNSLLSAKIYTCVTSFWASDHNNFIKSSDHYLRSTLFFNTPGTWRLQDSLTLKDYFYAPFVSLAPGISHNNGSIITNGYNMNLGAYYSATAATRTLDITGSRIMYNHFAGATTIGVTYEMQIQSDNYTLNASGSQIHLVCYPNPVGWYNALGVYGSAPLQFNDIYYHRLAGYTSAWGNFHNSTAATCTINTLWSDVDNFNVNGTNIINTLRFRAYSINVLEKNQTQFVDSLIAISQNCSGSAYIKSSQSGVNAKLLETSGNAAFKSINFNIEDIESHTSPTYPLTGDADALGITSIIKSAGTTYTNINGWAKSNQLVTYDFGFDTLNLNCNNPISLSAVNFLANSDSYYEWKRETSPGVFAAITATNSTQDSVIAKLPGRYYCKVTYIHPSCYAEDTVYVKFTNSITSSYTITPITCNGFNDGAISFSLTSGVSTGTALPHFYQYNWQSGGTSSTATNTNTNVYNSTYSGLAPNVYTVTLLDTTASVATASLSACKLVETFTVTQPNPLLTGAAISSTIACFGNSTGALTSNPTGGNGGYTFSWTDGTTTYTTQNVNTIPSNVYTLTVTDSKTCTATTTLNITQPPSAITATIGSVSDVLCFGGATGAATVNASGGTGAITYTWLPSGGNNATATGLTINTYTVNMLDANNCPTSQTLSISQPTAALSIAGANSNSVACFGANTGSLSISITGGTITYTTAWSGPNSYTNTNSGTTSTLTSLSQGSYNGFVTDANGCTTNTTIVIAQPSASLALSANSTSVACFSANTGSASVSVSGGTGPYTYTWTPGTSNVSTLNSISAGDYTVSILDANLCPITQSFSISQPTAALSVSSVNTQSVLCFGNGTGSATITTAGGTPNYTYTSNSGTSNNPIINNLTVGTYTYYVTDANGCATNTQTFIIAQPSLGLSAIGTQTDVLCNGQSNGIAQVTPIGGTSGTGYTYSWSPSSVTSTTNTANSLSATNYTATITDANGCATTQTFTIIEPTLLSVSITASTQANCGVSNGSATYTATGGTAVYTYSWVTPSTSYTTSSTITNSLSAGFNQLTVVDANGCTTNTSVNITNPNAPNVVATATNVNCFGASTGAVSTSVTATSAYTYTWSNGSFASDIYNVPAGSYTVTVMDVNNCITAQIATVTQPTSAISLLVSNITNVNCFGQNTGSASALATGGTPNYTYTWNPGGSNNQTLNTIPAGNYTISATDSKGCITNSVVVINSASSSALDVLVSSLEQATCEQQNGSITTVVTGGTANYNYSWNTGTSTNQTLNNVGAGTYTLIVSDVYNCKDTLTVTLDCKIDLFIPQLFSPNADGKNDKFEIKGIANYPNNNIQIFNRWGSLVYSKNKYNNEWDGKANVGDALGKSILPAGTYYVVLEFGDGETKPYHGYVQMEY